MPAFAAHTSRTLALALPLVLLLLSFVPSVNAEDAPSKPAATSLKTEAASPHPVLLIGVDGLEWTVAFPLIRNGRLPVLAKLMANGVYGKIDSQKPTSSPTIWTSVVTGMRPMKHGIVSFVDRSRSEGDQLRLFNNRDRKVKAIWNILSERQMRVGVVGWWMTHPVEAIHGVMVAQTNTTPGSVEEKLSQGWKGALYAGVPGQVHPPALEEEILSQIAKVDAGLPALVKEVFGEPPDSFGGVPEKLWRESLWSIRGDELYRRVGTELLRKEPNFDLFAIYFGMTDVISHRYWRYMSPRDFIHKPTAKEIKAFASFIPRAYVHIDRVIGELIAAAPKDVNVLVMSDHGMGPINTQRKFTPDRSPQELRSGAHREAPPGIFVAAGPDFIRPKSPRPLKRLRRRGLKEVGSVLDVTPTLLRLFGIPLGSDMHGEVMTGVLAPSVTSRAAIPKIASHTPEDWRSYQEPVPDVDGKIRIEQLRALGYIEDSDE